MAYKYYSHIHNTVLETLSHFLKNHLPDTQFPNYEGEGGTEGEGHTVT